MKHGGVEVEGAEGLLVGTRVGIREGDWVGDTVLVLSADAKQIFAVEEYKVL